MRTSSLEAYARGGGEGGLAPWRLARVKGGRGRLSHLGGDLDLLGLKVGDLLHLRGAGAGLVLLAAALGGRKGRLGGCGMVMLAKALD